MAKQKFVIGRLLITPGVQNLFKETKEDLLQYVNRHAMGDWGNCSAKDKKQNDLAVILGERIFSRYDTKDGTALWIITEASRSYTTVLLPREY